VNFSRMVLL